MKESYFIGCFYETAVSLILRFNCPATLTKRIKPYLSVVSLSGKAGPRTLFWELSPQKRPILRPPKVLFQGSLVLFVRKIDVSVSLHGASIIRRAWTTADTIIRLEWALFLWGSFPKVPYFSTDTLFCLSIAKMRVLCLFVCVSLTYANV